MRHLVSVLLAVVTGPLVLLLAGRGLVGLEAAAQADRTDQFGLVTGGSALGLAGLVYAVLILARLAPLGPTLLGIGYVAIGWWALHDPGGYLATVQDNPVLGGAAVAPADQHLLVAGQIAPLLAVPLLATFVMPSRWRHYPSDQDRHRIGDRDDVEPGGTLSTDTLDDLPRVNTGPPPQPSTPPQPGFPPPTAHYPPHHQAPNYPPPHHQAPHHPTVPQPPAGGPGGGQLHGAPSEEATLSLSPEETTTNLRPSAGAPPPDRF